MDHILTLFNVSHILTLYSQSHKKVSMSTKVVFGKFAKEQSSFEDLLTNEKEWCWKFILDYSKDPKQFINIKEDDNTNNKEIERNCKDLYKFLCNNSISQKKILSKYGKNCQKKGIKNNIPTLINGKIYWLFAENPSFKMKGRNVQNSGKWMLFCNKKFLTYSYNYLHTELTQIGKSKNNDNDNDDDKDDDEKKDETKPKKSKKNFFKKDDDIMLTELDYYWLKVSKLVETNNLGFSAKVSTNTNLKKRDDPNGVIIIYCSNSDDKNLVLKIAQNIRNLVGFTEEEIRYKTDRATVQFKYGPDSHLYKHTMSKFNELQVL